MKYIVSNTIQAPDNEPVTIPWYSGDNLAQAMSALASIAADSTGPSDAVPESIRFKVLSVDMQVIHDPEAECEPPWLAGVGTEILGYCDDLRDPHSRTDVCPNWVRNI